KGSNPRDRNDDAAAHCTGDQLLRDTDGFGQRYALRHRFKKGRVEVLGQATPSFEPFSPRAHHAVDADEGNASQNERGNGLRKRQASGQPAGGDHLQTSSIESGKEEESSFYCSSR